MPVQPVFKKRNISIHPADILLDILQGLPDAAQSWTHVYLQWAEEGLYLYEITIRNWNEENRNTVYKAANSLNVINAFPVGAWTVHV